MERSHFKKFMATLALAALAACGGGAGTTQILPAPQSARTHRDSVLARIVGVGDSLTAGYQSDGILGKANARNPLAPGEPIPPTQENGWWTLLFEQASSSPLQDAIAQVYDPATSPLPLITGPGLDNQVVPTGPSQLFPFGQFKGTDPCKFDHGFNQAGFLLNGSARVRMDPNDASILDFGVPGITLHEAVVLHQPQTSTCSPLPGIPGLLSDVVSEESGTFWPVLRNFTKLGGHLTDVNAAASVHPTLATVWLGANDVLKYMGSGGRFVGGDRTPGQAESDVRAAITSLRRAGARVVVANLPNILETGFFQRVTTAPDTACVYQSYAKCLLALLRMGSFVHVIAKQYHLATPGGCIPASTDKPCGYLTLPGALLVMQYYNNPSNQGQLPNLDCPHPAPHCKVVPGSGLGMNYITPGFAAKVQALNNAVNQGIADAASATHTPLVNVYEIFHGLASGNQSNSYYALAASINPGVCCHLGYIHPVGSSDVPGGILSFDGIHPSDTGYALVAYEFIDTINKAYGTHIPQVDLKAVYDGTRCTTYCYPDPYAPH